MAGYGLPNEYHLSVVLEKSFKEKGKNIKIINGSVSGSTSSGGLNRAEWSLSDKNIDLMILGLGANDMLRGITPDETEENLEKIIKIAKSKNIKIILAGMLAPSSYGKDYKKSFDQIYKNLSIKYDLTLIPFLLEGVAFNPDLNQSDGIHPNKKGTVVISKILELTILKYIK